MLDLTRDVSHAVDRPAAPLTAYLLGLAVGGGLTLPDATERVKELTAGWAQAPGILRPALTGRAASPGPQ